MNIYKNHRKSILYGSIFLISILLVIFIQHILIIPINFKTIALISIPLLVIVVYIVYIISSHFKKLDLYLPRDLADYLSSSGLKIKYYNAMSTILKCWNMASLGVFVFIVVLILFMLLAGFVLLSTNIIKGNTTTIPELLFNNSLMKYTLTVAVSSSIAFVLISFTGVVIFTSVFPLNKSSGLVDTSEIPISFIAKAIDDINSFSFSLPWDDLQQNRKKISNLVHDALEFITIEDNFFAIPLGMRYSQFFISGLKNKAARRDILQRINGLTDELGEIIIKLNCMNSVSDQEDISNKLKQYLKIIEDRNICAIKNKVEYREDSVIWNTIEKIGLNPIYYITRIIFRL